MRKKGIQKADEARIKTTIIYSSVLMKSGSVAKRLVGIDKQYIQDNLLSLTDLWNIWCASKEFERGSLEYDMEINSPLQTSVFLCLMVLSINFLSAEIVWNTSCK